jgi:ectoine hydroxylase-related dioxygenase (phytanoyl-CoA dioxygenase family)
VSVDSQSLPYQFAADDLDAAIEYMEAHGFAVITRVITQEFAALLRAEVCEQVDPKGALANGEARYGQNYIEAAPVFRELFANTSFTRLLERMVKSSAITVNRSAAIMRAPGNPGISWHMDRFAGAVAETASDVLNDHDYPAGIWLYLNGSRPALGGLAVIADSHRPDWNGPPGFCFIENRFSFCRAGASKTPYLGMDVPGVVPVLANPEDAIVFAARTYHAAYDYPAELRDPRLSVGMSVRPASLDFTAKWPLGDNAKRMIATAPPYLLRFLNGYRTNDQHWSAAVTSSKKIENVDLEIDAPR